MVVFLVTYQTPNANKQPQEQQQDLLVGLGDMPGNDGGTPEGNYGQHDCRGDLQGQADLLDKVSADFDLLIYGPQQCCSFDLKFYLPGCLM